MYYRLLLFLLAGACLLPAAAAPVWECDFTRPEIREAVRKSPCASLKKALRKGHVSEEKVKELIAWIESDELASDEEALKNEETDG